MDLQQAYQSRPLVEDFQRRHRIGLLTLMFTDLVGSTKLKQVLGDRHAIELIQFHHAQVRALLGEFPEAEEISTAGDSFFLVFAKPSDAAKFALQLQARLRAADREAGQPLRDRVGVHVGEVFIEARDETGQAKDLYGLQVDTAARIVSLASGDQILMSRFAFDSARQVLRGVDMGRLDELSWMNHGFYELAGVEEPVEICEVGEQGRAALAPPGDSDKANRHPVAGAESVLGWRPAVGTGVPKTSWVLDEKLGAGGFGEVWLAHHEKLKEKRVFKFCFRADRVRTLKREATLFRLLKERLGEHPKIVRIHDVYLEEPPYYLITDYVAGRDLHRWSEAQGGIDKTPLELRIEIVAQTAEALQAAHDAGVLHRDIKPGNILVAGATAQSDPSQVRVKLTDFGIGQVVSAEALQGMTRMGFTQTVLSSESGSQSGTHLYMAPELLTGQPATPRSDIYSLGVVLYQSLIGDFTQPVTTDWHHNVEDPLLRADLAGCFAGHPNDRFAGAAQLAKNLRSLPERRAALERQKAEAAARERAAYRRGMLRTAAIAAMVLVVISGLTILSVVNWRAERTQRLIANRNLYIAKMNLAQQAWEESDIPRLRGLLAETRDYPDRGFEWYFWQRQIHGELRTLEVGGPVQSLAISPDGSRIVTASATTAAVWDLSSGRQILSLQGHAEPVTSASYSPDGRCVATASDDQTARVWDAATGAAILTLRGHGNRVSAIAFSPDGRRIVTGSYDRTAKIWDASSGTELQTLTGHDASVASVAFSPDGRQVVSGSFDQRAKVWDAATGREVLTLAGRSVPVNWAFALLVASVAFSRDGRWVVAGGSSGSVMVWDASTGQIVRTLEGHTDSITSLDFSPDGRRIATGSFDRTARVWDASTGREILIFKGHGHGVRSVAFASDGQRLITGGYDGTVKLWQVPADRDLPTFQRHAWGIRSIAFSPDGQRMVTGSEDWSAAVWDTASGKELRRLQGHRSEIYSVAFSPDGRRIATASSDRTARVWDASTGREILALKGHGAALSAVAFSPDGRRIVSASADRTARIWDSSSGAPLLTVEGQKEMLSVAFSPDGRWLVTSNRDGTSKVWDAASGQEVLSRSGVFHSLAFSADGTKLVAGGSDRTAKVWDTATGREILSLTGHRNAVSSVGFSPDGRRIVTASDPTVKVWDTASGRELLTLRKSYVTAVAFSPDGRRLVTASYDGSAVVWDSADPEQVSAWQRREQSAARAER